MNKHLMKMCFKEIGPHGEIVSNNLLPFIKLHNKNNIYNLEEVKEFP